MKNVINKYKLSISYILVVILTSFVFTLLEYIFFNYKLFSILEVILNYFYVFIYSYISSRKSPLNGYKSGFRSGVKIWIILILLNLITFNNFTLGVLLYYIIILIIAIIAGIISKNKEKNYSN